MTWKELKTITLQKMFAIPGNDIILDESTSQYLASMPYAANEGILQIATAGKGIVKLLEIAHDPIPNLIDDGHRIVSYRGEPVSFTCEGAKSFYFETLGPATVVVQAVGQEQQVISIEAGAHPVFVPQSGLIENPEGKAATIVFQGEYPYMLRNTAMYAYSFPNDVQPFTKEIRFDLREYAPDFYRLKQNDISFEGKELQKPPDYRWEGDSILIIPREAAGMYRVYYYAYPVVFTPETPDDFVIGLAPDALALLPLYIASQLYKDDDLAIATVFRNEFEVGLERLTSNVAITGKEEFTSESRWW